MRLSPLPAPPLGLLLLAMGCSEYKLGAGDINSGPNGDIEDQDGWDGSWDDSPTDGAAAIQVLPDPFDFGRISRCNADGFPWFVRNVGDRDLTVTGIALAGAGDVAAISSPSAPQTLAPGEWFSGTVSWDPSVGAVAGVFTVESDDAQAPTVSRPLSGDACDDGDGDGACDDDDPDIDGDGIANDADPFPSAWIADEVNIDFDDLDPGDLVAEQYAGNGVHFEGGGAPGEGYDSNVVAKAAAATSAVVATSPNVLLTYVNAGFNHEGAPGLAGWLDMPADVFRIRLYNAGLIYAADAGGESDQGTLVGYDDSGAEVSRDTLQCTTDDGDEYVDLEVLGSPMTSFEVYTGDFDAVDDLAMLWLWTPECGK